MKFHISLFGFQFEMTLDGNRDVIQHITDMVLMTCAVPLLLFIAWWVFNNRC